MRNPSAHGQVEINAEIAEINQYLNESGKFVDCPANFVRDPQDPTKCHLAITSADGNTLVVLDVSGNILDQNEEGLWVLADDPDTQSEPTSAIQITGMQECVNVDLPNLFLIC